MTPLKFTHTTHNSDVYVYPDQIIATLYLPQFKSIALMGPGGAYIPIHGDLEEVTKQVTQAKANQGRQTNTHAEHAASLSQEGVTDNGTKTS